MDKNIAVYNNSTGIVEVMKSLFIGEDLNMMKVSTLEELLKLVKDESIHLILVDLELEGSGLGYGMEIIQHIILIFRLFRNLLMICSQKLKKI